MCENNYICYDLKMICSDSLQLIMMDFYISVCQSKAQSESLRNHWEKANHAILMSQCFFF